MITRSLGTAVKPFNVSPPRVVVSFRHSFHIPVLHSYAGMVSTCIVPEQVRPWWIGLAGGRYPVQCSARFLAGGISERSARSEYMIIYRDQNAGRSKGLFQDIRLGTTQANQNPIYKETESRLKSGNACYLFVLNLLSSSLLSKSIKIKIHRTVILPLVVYGCETWSLTLREERRLRVFGKRVLRRIFGH
jgi:hypothetical protein